VSCGLRSLDVVDTATYVVGRGMAMRRCEIEMTYEITPPRSRCKRAAAAAAPVEVCSVAAVFAAWGEDRYSTLLGVQFLLGLSLEAPLGLRAITQSLLYGVGSGPEASRLGRGRHS